jgi:hypothetical protein
MVEGNRSMGMEIEKDKAIKQTIAGILLLAGLWFFFPWTSAARQEQMHEQPPIEYRRGVSDDAIARLKRRLESGEISLEYNEPRGYLDSVLKNLGAPVSSQGLVFSKTSFQLHRIMPSNPRAIYFSDDAYVGFVQGGDILELAAVDANVGGVFYILEQVQTSRPRIRRNDDCLQCHATNGTRNVPGFLVRSVYPDARAYPISPLGGFISDQNSPLKERWGGWYVTGVHGSARHLGNQRFDEKGLEYNPANLTTQNLANLEARFDTSRYLSPHSDIVALMVLEHQTQAHNLITRLNHITRLALHQQSVMNEALKEPASYMSDSTRRRIEHAADDALRYLLMAGEARWSTPIKGTTDYARQFAAQGVRDKRGRSLRELDLQTKLFRYPCSYLIYSESIDALPNPALDYFYRQLWLALIGRSTDKALASIPVADRKAVLEILRETRSNLPDFFQQDEEN